MRAPTKSTPITSRWVVPQRVLSQPLPWALLILMTSETKSPWTITSTLSTTNLRHDLRCEKHGLFLGLERKNSDVFEGVYGLAQDDRYDSNDPELFMGHGTANDPVTPYEEALELQSIYTDLGVHNELATLLSPDGSPRRGTGLGMHKSMEKAYRSWTFDFLVERQNLNLQ